MTSALPVGGDQTLDARFARDGYVVVDLLGRDAVAALADAQAALAPGRASGFDSTLLDPDPARKLATDALVRRTLGPALERLARGYRVAFCTFVTKEPQSDASEVPLHQDWSFADEPAQVSLGVWCPLVPVDPRNGCLQVAPGSHAFAYPPRAVRTRFPYTATEPALRARRLAAIPMAAGQALLFDHRLIHGSPPNRSDTRRVAATAVLVPEGDALRCFICPDRHAPDRVEAFAVADDFYLRHTPGRTVAEGRSLGVSDHAALAEAARQALASWAEAAV